MANSPNASFWETLKGTAYGAGAAILKPLDGTFSTVIGNATNRAQAKVAEVADKLNKTSAPQAPAGIPQTSPQLPVSDAAQSAGFTLIGLVVAALVVYFLMGRRG